MGLDDWYFTEDIDDFLARAGDFLCSRPVRHNTPLTTFAKMRAQGAGTHGGEAPEGPRDGYSRAQFKHWNKGLNPTDGCDTRLICTLKSGWSAMPLVHMDLSAVVVLRHVRHRERKRVARIIPLSSGLSPGRYSLRP
jgi:hypothetical protein